MSASAQTGIKQAANQAPALKSTLLKRSSDDCPSSRPQAAAVVYINPSQTGSYPTESYLIIARGQFT